jgi:hypothetical protein
VASLIKGESVALRVLAYPSPSEPVQWLHFRADDSVLLAASSARVWGWNLLTCSVDWTLEVAGGILAFDAVPAKGFALLQGTRADAKHADDQDAEVQCYAFGASAATTGVCGAPSAIGEPLPVGTPALQGGQEDGRSGYMRFVQSQHTATPSLVVLQASRGQVLRLDNPLQLQSKTARRRAAQQEAKAAEGGLARRSMFTDIYGEISTAQQSQGLGVTDMSASSATDRLFAAPAHMLPSVSVLCSVFLGECLKRNYDSSSTSNGKTHGSTAAAAAPTTMDVDDDDTLDGEVDRARGGVWDADVLEVDVQDFELEESELYARETKSGLFVWKPKNMYTKMIHATNQRVQRQQDSSKSNGAAVKKKKTNEKRKQPPTTTTTTASAAAAATKTSSSSAASSVGNGAQRAKRAKRVTSKESKQAQEKEEVTPAPPSTPTAADSPAPASAKKAKAKAKSKKKSAKGSKKKGDTVKSAVAGILAHKGDSVVRTTRRVTRSSSRSASRQ